MLVRGLPNVTGTMVMTDKGYKKIEDIEVGDKVLTPTNEFKEVRKVNKTGPRKRIRRIK